MNNFYSNIDTHGGKFLNIVDREISTAKNVMIASGYTSFDILNRYKGRLSEIAREGGSSKLLLGMAFYEGLTHNKLELLKNICSELNSINSDSGVYVTYSGKYHGKVYMFDDGRQQKVYLGSSNFSRSGLSENIEYTASITDADSIQTARGFLDFLFSDENAVSILDADITVPGTTKYLERISLKTLDDLQRYPVESINKDLYPQFEIDVARLAEKEKSNLNVYFGKGRWARSTGKVVPRPWYEVEIIAPTTINSNPLYPHGEFLAYTDDGYIIPMKTSGDYFKNIRSRGNLQLLGQWIKGKLQKAGALLPLTPVTQDTLDAYGSDKIRLYKIDDQRYYMEF